MYQCASIVALIAASLLSTACAKVERAAPIFLSDANILSIMNTADRSDIEGGRLAETRAVDPQVRDFGRRMVADHSAMLEENKQLSHRFDIEPLSSAVNKQVIEQHGEALDTLLNKTGAEFDRAYIDQEIERHERLVALVGKATTSASHVALKEHLRQVEPMLQDHLEAARNIKIMLAAQNP